MHGKLDPEENVMKDNRFTQEDLWQMMSDLGWDTHRDKIVLDVGGVATSGIDVGEEYNKKWQSPKGTVKYNKDAFIVIKNISRTPFEPSQPNHELKSHHIKVAEQEIAIQQDEKAIAAALKKSDDEKGYDTYSK